MPKVITEYSPFQFLFFRGFFSIYLIHFFLFYFPHLEQMGDEFTLMNLVPKMPVLVTAAALALLLGLGIYRRFVATILFLFWIIECNTLAFQYNPATFMTAFLLLVCATTAGHEPRPEFPGVRVVAYRICWFMFFILVVLDVATAFHFAFDLPAFGIRGDLQFRPPMFWLWARMGASVFFLVLMIYSGTRAFAWLILVGLNLAWLMRFGYHDFSAISLIALVFLYNSRWSTKTPDEKLKPTIFFDGLCVLCNRFAKFVIREDFLKHFYLATIQGKMAKETLPRDKVNNPSTIIYLDDGKLFEKSDAILRILSEIGGLWSFCKIFLIVPKSLRDAIYDFIARNRYNWFGTLNQCSLPTPDQRDIFKD